MNKKSMLKSFDPPTVGMDCGCVDENLPASDIGNL